MPSDNVWRGENHLEFWRRGAADRWVGIAGRVTCPPREQGWRSPRLPLQPEMEREPSDAELREHAAWRAENGL